MLMKGPNSWPIWGKSGLKQPCFDPCPYILWKSNMIMIVENLSFIDVLIEILDSQLPGLLERYQEFSLEDLKRKGRESLTETYRNCQNLATQSCLDDRKACLRQISESSGQDTQNKRQLSSIARDT